MWFPILAPIVLTLFFFISHRMLRFDFLMPAELFRFALVGGLLMLWAALRVHVHRRLISWSLGTTVVMLAGSQGLAVITGLASGENEPAGWRLIVVMAPYALFCLALLALGIGGVFLVRDVFKMQARQ